MRSAEHAALSPRALRGGRSRRFAHRHSGHRDEASALGRGWPRRRAIGHRWPLRLDSGRHRNWADGRNCEGGGLCARSPGADAEPPLPPRHRRQAHRRSASTVDRLGLDEIHALKPHGVADGPIVAGELSAGRKVLGSDIVAECDAERTRVRRFGVIEVAPVVPAQDPQPKARVKRRIGPEEFLHDVRKALEFTVRKYAIDAAVETPDELPGLYVLRHENADAVDRAWPQLGPDHHHTPDSDDKSSAPPTSSYVKSAGHPRHLTRLRTVLSV